MFSHDCTLTWQSAGSSIPMYNCTLSIYYQWIRCAGHIMETNVLLLYLVNALLLTNSLNNIQNKTIYFKIKNCISPWCKIKITIKHIMKKSTKKTIVFVIQIKHKVNYLLGLEPQARNRPKWFSTVYRPSK